MDGHTYNTYGYLRKLQMKRKLLYIIKKAYNHNEIGKLEGWRLGFIVLIIRDKYGHNRYPYGVSILVISK